MGSNLSCKHGTNSNHICLGVGIILIVSGFLLGGLNGIFNGICTSNSHEAAGAIVLWLIGALCVGFSLFHEPRLPESQKLSAESSSKDIDIDLTARLDKEFLTNFNLRTKLQLIEGRRVQTYEPILSVQDLPDEYKEEYNNQIKLLESNAAKSELIQAWEEDTKQLLAEHKVGSFEYSYGKEDFQSGNRRLIQSETEPTHLPISATAGLLLLFIGSYLLRRFLKQRKEVQPLLPRYRDSVEQTDH